MSLREDKSWEFVIRLSATLVLLLVAYELIFGESEWVFFCETIFASIVLVDIFIGMYYSENKLNYLKKNFFKILVFMPWGLFFRVLKLFRLDVFLEELVVLDEAVMVERFGFFGRFVKFFAKIQEFFSEL